MTRVTLLGATGTIGQNTLKIIAAHPEDFSLVALTAGENVQLLAEQAKQYRPQRAVIANEALYDELKTLLTGTGIEAAAGEEAVIEAARMPVDVTMVAIVGAAALKPTMAAIEQGKKIALANKECLVCAGELVNKHAQKYGAKLLPVDSEHNAIFQVFDHHNPQFIDRVILTASGGPFRSFTTAQMQAVTPEQAVRHPNWNMGAKISVDSASMMNKGLELIEAYYLFPLRAEQLGVLVHPQSIIHCLVHMIDGSVLAQMSLPDMCTPIAHALAWPQRIKAPVGKLDLAQIGSLQFEAPDEARFPALRLAMDALKTGKTAPPVLNAANEVGVARFLAGQIGFLDIIKTVERTLENMDTQSLETVEDVFACDSAARRFAKQAI